MARVTFEGLRRLRPDRRPFVISRAGFAGLQRYAVHWTGDNSSWWEHLWMSMPQLQNLGLSGYAFVGVDVGGFAGDATGELLARWTEFGVFQPFCRNHSAWDTHPQEPWAFGEPWETCIRAMLRLRQRLLPYLYTLFEEAHRTGAPILRPLLFEYPDDPTTCSTDDELLLGSALLVAPITRPGIEHRHVYLPAGTWVHYWSGRQSVGPVHLLAHAPLGQPAVYVRANTPVPLWPDTAPAADSAPHPLTWLVCAAVEAADGSGAYYADDGEGYAYLDGDFVRTRVSCHVSREGVDLEFARSGHGQQRHPRTHLDIRGVARPTHVLVDGSPTDDWEHAADRLLVRLDGRDAVSHVHVDAPPTMTAV
jgi:alpha-glucosidase